MYNFLCIRISLPNVQNGNETSDSDSENNIETSIDKILLFGYG